jgi:hypothetical protein
MKLFMIYIGGKHEKSLIELHDIRFVMANTIEETYSALKKSWWGTPESLHLDCWGAVNSIDGYELRIHSYPQQRAEQIYFVNLGGYDSAQFTELHENILLVASSPAEAKQKAIARMRPCEVPHRDYAYEVESILCLEDMGKEQGLFLHLEPSSAPAPFEFTCLYTPIGKH